MVDTTRRMQSNNGRDIDGQPLTIARPSLSRPKILIGGHQRVGQDTAQPCPAAL